MAPITAEATEAAGAQGAFWEMHDMIYERSSEWAGLSVEQTANVLTDYAAEIGLDTAQFRSDLDNGTFSAKVQAQYQDAVNMGLPGTPTFIVNGRLYPTDQWGLSEQGIDVFIRLATMEQYDSPPPEVINPAGQYVATIRTERGDIVIELYTEQAPNSVNTFAFLAQDGWYDDTTFFRVLEGFVAQAGDPTATAVGNPGFQCDEEIHPSLSFDDVGVVGIASAGPGTNTGSSQFFITLAPQPDLTGNYTIIGKVIEGLDVLQSITPRDPSDPTAPPGDLIETILIEER